MSRQLTQTKRKILRQIGIPFVLWLTVEALIIYFLCSNSINLVQKWLSPFRKNINKSILPSLKVAISETLHFLDMLETYGIVLLVFQIFLCGFLFWVFLKWSLNANLAQGNKNIDGEKDNGTQNHGHPSSR